VSEKQASGGHTETPNGGVGIELSTKKEAEHNVGFRAWLVILVVGGTGLEPVTPCV
jgi:hypothetical protein